MPSTKDKWVRRFIIPETTRHRKGFTIYKVTSVIYLKASREEVSKVSVWKRYNDFKKLHSTLHALHARFQIKDPFPPFTKSKFFGRFEVEVVQERKIGALKFLDFIGKHQCLYTSEAFIKFFENSLNDSHTNDRSQSVGSDTSEDDRTVGGLNDPGLANNIDVIESARLSSGGGGKVLDGEKSSFKGNRGAGLPLKEYENECNAGKSDDDDDDDDAAAAADDGLGIGTSASKVEEQLSENGNDKRENTKDERYEIKRTKMLKIKSPKVIQDRSDLGHTCKDITHYIVVAAAYISAAFKHEAIAEYEEAFAQYKMGISTLLLGVETDPDDARKVIIKEKVSKYLDRAEKLYNRYLNWNISILNKPTSDLKNYKVLKIIDSVMLVKDLHTNSVRIVKSIEKSLSNKENISNYILRGEIPFMVRLHGYIETEATVFLILEYVKRGRLWDFIMKNYKSYDDPIPFEGDDRSERLGIGDERRRTFEGTFDNDDEIKLITEYGETERLRSCDDDDGGGGGDGDGDGESTMTNLVTSKEDNAYNADEIRGSDVPTTQLLEKAQKLLRSVNATLKRSNFVGVGSNESNESIRRPSSPKTLGNNKVSPAMSASEGNNRKKRLSDSLDFRFGDLQEEDDRWSSGGGTDASSDSMINSFESLKTDDATTMIEERRGGDTSKGSKESSRVEGSTITEVAALWEIPEEVVCRWAAEILLALEALHQRGVVIFDLKPDKILLDDYGHVTLTYIVPCRNPESTKIRQEYSSPELYMFSPTTTRRTTPATDVWNYGIILYELLTGIKFGSLHGGPFRSHSVVSIPTKLSINARDLLFNILKYEPEERLTISDIKKHYFFQKIDWSSMVYSTI